MRSKKKVILDLIISNLKKGISPAQICKEKNIKKQTLQYYLRELKKKGIVQKVAYGTWTIKKEVSKTTKATKNPKQIRGHAFTWRIRFKTEVDWKKRLEKFKIPHETLGVRGNTPRIILNNKKIWLTKRGLVIYEPKSFLSNSSFTSKGMAVWEMDKTVKEIYQMLQINLGGYEFTTSREHYGQIKNELARQYNEKGEKLYIADRGGIWMWIDDSHSLSELETNKPQTSKRVQDWYNDMKKTNFEITPTFLMESLNKLTRICEGQQREIEDLRQAPNTLKMPEDKINLTYIN